MSASSRPRDDSWSTHEAFASEIDVKVAEIGLYLVVAAADSGAMHAALESTGAQIAATVSPTRVLAVMGFSAFQALRVDPAIGLVGPVTIDAERFDHFQRLVGIDAG